MAVINDGPLGYGRIIAVPSRLVCLVARHGSQSVVSGNSNAVSRGVGAMSCRRVRSLVLVVCLNVEGFTSCQGYGLAETVEGRRETA